MTDHRPPLLADDERTTLVTSLQFQRDSLLRAVAGIDGQMAARVMVPSGTSLVWLIRHCRYAERVWLEQRFARRSVDLPDPALDSGTLADAVDAYRLTWNDVDTIVAAASLDDRVRAPGDDPPVNLRWILVHLIEELARHAGHADILREQLDGTTGR